MHTISQPETQLVVATSGLPVDDTRIERIRSIVVQPLDWPAVIQRSRSLGTTPMLFENLKPHADLVPAQVLEQLREGKRGRLRRNLNMTSQLIRILAALESSGISALTFKGPTLAMLAYGDLGLRNFGDVDVLVGQGDFAKAIELLQQMGFHHRKDLAHRHLECLIRSVGQIQLVGKNGVCVELHSKLTRQRFYFPLDFEELWSRRQLVSVVGHLLPTFGCEDLCLYLAVHGAKHIWARLGWVTDWAALMHRQPEMNWPRIVEFARRTRCETMLRLAAWLSDHPELAERPEAMVSGDQSNDKVDLLGRFVMRYMLGTEKIPRWSMAWYDLHVRDRRRDAFRYLVYRAVEPHQSDWEWVALPERLSFLYPLLRPPRLVFNEIRRLSKM